MIRAIALLALLATPCVVGVAQESRPSGVERWIELARSGAPHIRPQAAQRLVGSGAEGADAIREAAGDSLDGLAALGADLVEVLARFDDAELRELAWRATGDPDFPWRPSAARSLASTPAEGERERFEGLLEDPLPAVRVAALSAFAASRDMATVELLRRSLEDEDGRVRRAAAFEIADRGVGWATLWLIEELERTDRWFEIETGRVARFEAARLLQRLGMELGEYDPAASPLEPSNAAAVDALRSRVETSLEREPPSIPAVARAEDIAPPGRIGLELRSCRKGELFFQWGPGDFLYVGRGRPRELRLPAGTVARLEAIAADSLVALGEARLFGQPGCDLESVRVVGAEGALDTVFMQKGPEPRPELRPEALDGLARALVDSIPEGDVALRERLRSALLAVGGPLETGGAGD